MTKTNTYSTHTRQNSPHNDEILGADKLAGSWKLKLFQIVYILIVWQKCLGVNCHRHSMYTPILNGLNVNESNELESFFFCFCFSFCRPNHRAISISAAIWRLFELYKHILYAKICADNRNKKRTDTREMRSRCLLDPCCGRCVAAGNSQFVARLKIKLK